MTTLEMLPTQRISLAVEEFTNRNLDELAKILMSEEGRHYVGSLKFSKSMFEDRAIVEELSPYYRGTDRHLYPVIADISLSGGYADSVHDVHSTVKRNGFLNSIFTLSRIPQDEILFIRDNIQPAHDDCSIQLLLTGGLPENRSADFRDLFKVGKKKFTEEKLKQASELGLLGVYASAGLISERSDVFTLGAGISFDGDTYWSDGVPKKSVTVEEALRRCSQFVVGRILFSPNGSIRDNFLKICEMIEASTDSREQ